MFWGDEFSGVSKITEFDSALFLVKNLRFWSWYFQFWCRHECIDFGACMIFREVVAWVFRWLIFIWRFWIYFWDWREIILHIPWWDIHRRYRHRNGRERWDCHDWVSTVFWFNFWVLQCVFKHVIWWWLFVHIRI